MHKVILDTDIGTDVDDALALAALLGSPEVELVGVTTVYGDTVVRARLTRRLLELAGADPTLPVVPGCSETLSGRPVWWAGHEGRDVDDLERSPVDDAVPAADWLVETVHAHEGAIDLVAVGPLTNVATAIAQDPTFAGALRSLTIMGGDYRDGERESEWNFRCDADAVRIVLASGVNPVATGIDTTTRTRIEPADLERIGRAGVLGAALAAQIEQYWEFRGTAWNTPHDPAAVLALLVPELYDVEQTRVGVLTDTDLPGRVADEPDGFPLRVARMHDAGAVGQEIVSRIVAAGSVG
jgi:purine nucleosidase